MKWLLVAVAFALGAAITWFLTVKRVTQTVPAEAADAGDVDQGGSDMDSRSAHGVDGPTGDDGSSEPDAFDDDSDASRFGGERTSAPASSRVGWDHDAEDIDSLLSDDEKSDAEKFDLEESSSEKSDEEISGEDKSGAERKSHDV